MRIGFEVNQEDTAEQEVGIAMPVDQGSAWYAGLPEYFLELWMKFAIVYGTYAAIRDLIKSIA
ncbi:MAG: hypothetical protein HOB17_05415 [Candidatus Marinimicrobia bacterium]|mgnify:CR=1 FL=1|jgi:hypothetical protein|nr:hypothetical protein [Candidatus Neomarinimicrobiota bacterium]MBT5212813.1 hypothetical protein [Candidatus Neomarinimicrobiota bacterium]MBT6228750.1 hypothetical protein [Candidatus Scalindua sp.]MBT6713345.1 hypothetical protein [Candidatus Neomarinimicrobiota bacterium]MBT7095597.1 hypothetical protein [Bacteroidota bacterium]